MKTPSMMMNEVLKKRAKKNKKGFSLVELIVVLVIMAILIAALVPSLVGYIRQARQSTAKDEAAAAVSAAQTIASSAYADPSSTYHNNSSAGDVTISDFGDTAEFDATSETNYVDAIKELAEVDGTINAVKLTGGRVSDLEYTTTNGQQVNYNGRTYTVAS